MSQFEFLGLAVGSTREMGAVVNQFGKEDKLRSVID